TVFDEMLGLKPRREDAPAQRRGTIFDEMLGLQHPSRAEATEQPRRPTVFDEMLGLAPRVPSATGRIASALARDPLFQRATPEERETLIDIQRQRMGLAPVREEDFQRQLAGASRELVERMTAAERLVAAYGASAFGKEHAIASRLMGDDVLQKANQAIRQAILERHPVGGNVAAVTGQVLNPSDILLYSAGLGL